MKPTIRRAHPGEAPRLTAIAHAAKRHWGYPEEYLRLWRDELTISPRFAAEAPVWCAVLEDEVVGFYVITLVDGAWELDHLWVDPTHHGKGLGSALLRHARQLARRKGATALRIVADPNAVGFYVRQGAVRVGSVASVPEGRKLPLMELSLSRA